MKKRRYWTDKEVDEFLEKREKQLGYIREYPCVCSGTHSTCWIVEHPVAKPPPSFTSEEEARGHLKLFREKGEEHLRSIYPNLERWKDK